MPTATRSNGGPTTCPLRSWADLEALAVICWRAQLRAVLAGCLSELEGLYVYPNGPGTIEFLAMRITKWESSSLPLQTHADGGKQCYNDYLGKYVQQTPDCWGD